MADPERTLEVLAGLRTIGVATSLDDFGAGHVSLGHLRQLDLDEIKIDRSFVMRLADDERDAAIVHATVDLGRRLGMRVVAEGVESAETWDALAGLHCDEAQGFFLGRPMTANALGGLVARTRRGLTAPPPSGEQRRELELGHLLVGRTLARAFGRVEQLRQHVDVAGREQEDLRVGQHPAHRQVDLGLVLERLVPGRRRLARVLPTACRRGS